MLTERLVRTHARQPLGAVTLDCKREREARAYIHVCYMSCIQKHKTQTHTRTDTHAYIARHKRTHPGSTNIAGLYSRGHSPQVHKYCSIVLLWSTNKQFVCSHEHSPAVLVLPGAQSSSICAPGSTIEHFWCSREHN